MPQHKNEAIAAQMRLPILTETVPHPRRVHAVEATSEIVLLSLLGGQPIALT